MGQIDPRLKAVMAEEIAIGVAWYVLHNYALVQHIDDAALLIGKQLQYVSTANSQQCPDYCALDGSNNLSTG